MSKPTLHEKMMKLHGAVGNGQTTKLSSYEIALKSKRQIAQNTYAFVFEKPKVFKFKAGQHIRLTLLEPSETDDKGSSRFFSVASSPKESDLEIAMRMRDTAFKRVIGRMPPGSKVIIQMMIHSHRGSFTLHDDNSKPAVFLVGGIGIAPAFSIIKDTLERKLQHKLYLFYSNRRPEDAPYLKELKTLEKQHPAFKLIATMTESEKSAKSWRGETSHIDQVMLRKYLGNLKSPVYYIAGLPEMVNSMKTLLVRVDVKVDNIRAEEFAGFVTKHAAEAVKHTSRSRAPLIVTALVILAIVIVHGAAALSVFKAGQSADFFKNPIVYLLIGFMLGIAATFKLKLLSGFRHGKHSKPAEKI